MGLLIVRPPQNKLKAQNEKKKKKKSVQNLWTAKAEEKKSTQARWVQTLG